MSGLDRQEYMTKAIIEAPIQVVATKNVIDICRKELKEISRELSKIEKASEINDRNIEVLKMIAEIIRTSVDSIKQEKSPQ